MNIKSEAKALDSSQVVIEKIILPSGDIREKVYNKGKFLGKGGFARVYELLCEETGEVFAGKFVPKNLLSKGRARHKLMSEIKIHRTLHNKNIVQFHHYFENDEFVYILLELCPNQSLSDMLRRRKRLLEIETQCYLAQVLSGLKYLHSHRIIHRDIKLGNIFLSDKMEVKIGDLGLAAKLEYEGERKRTICGTPNYIAPEILEGKQGHSYECDIWSFGVLMYTLLIGRPPFETKDVKTTYRRIKMNLYMFPDNIDISKEAKALITSILVLDFTKRPTIDQIFQNEFFTKNLYPRLMPLSTLVVPPSTNYIKQFLTAQGENEKDPIRASSQESQKSREICQNDKKRNHSRDPEKGKTQNSKVTPFLSSYKGTENDGPEIWVTKWLDYSARYGVGYMLSNKSIGAIFNDCTRIILSPVGDVFQYISCTSEGENVSTYNLSTFPQDLHKKVMLLLLFKRQLGPEETQKTDVKSNFHNVKKWSSTAHAVIFRLTSKVIQVCFRDSTELLLSSEKKCVTFVNKVKETCSYPLASAMDCGNKQLTKRLKYSKEVLTTMLKVQKIN